METTPDGSGRFNNKELGNLLPLYSVSMLLISAILHRDNILKGVFVPILIIAFAVSILCATRKAFAAIFIILIGTIISRKSQDKFVNYIFISLFFFLLYLSLVYVFNNMAIGNRISEGLNQTAKYNYTNNEYIDSFLNIIFGDRSVMYYLGLRLFFENPLTGIGICNYINLSGMEYRIHSEYMVQLCENGIIGFSLLMSLLLVFFYKMVNLKHRQRTHGIVFAGYFALLVIALWAWIYCVNFAMIIYAIILTTIYPDKKHIVIKA